MSRVANDTARAASRDARLVDADAFRRLCVARDRIRDAYAEPLSLAEMARVAGMSRFHFLRLFQRAFQRTPHAYLTEVRIARARSLLAERRHVTDVCFDVGFTSLGSFSTLFARRTGSAPSAYQRQLVQLSQVPGALVRQAIPYCFVSLFASR